MNPRDVGRDYDLGAPGFDGRFAANPRTVARYRRLEAPMLAVARGRVLDLGCGSGRLLGALGGVGVDLSAALLRAAREKGLAVARADAHALPFAANCFDAIIAANGVFRYLDPPRALAECARVLKRGGRLALHQFAAHTLRLTRPHPTHPGHLRDPEDLLAPARKVALHPLAVHLYRGLRFRPYILRLPRFLAGDLWDHVIIILEKR
jgi:SAM-dependent methyltransferase